ncbi:winged helix-turn-helix domain-containing protein [Verminephrobacter eiseniae]|uniref:winged helix-turn-helix domain-containing protein n=1 Tax=Verminephrobacter eiseniae TaxID=364317 RepID=UPI0038B40E47
MSDGSDMGTPFGQGREAIPQARSFGQATPTSCSAGASVGQATHGRSVGCGVSDRAMDAAPYRQGHQRAVRCAYSVGHWWRLLRRLGFSCQKPEKCALQRNEPEIVRCKRHGWPALKKSPARRPQHRLHRRIRLERMVHKVVIAMGIAASHVVRVQPAIAPCFRRLLRLFPVAIHDQGAAHAELAHPSRLDRLLRRIRVARVIRHRESRRS